MEAKRSQLRRRIVLAGLGLCVLAQAVPYGRDHVNPPLGREPKWDEPATRVLTQRACFNCHSNRTVWPWYSYVAPVSWLVARDVYNGRKKLNFSEFQNEQPNSDDASDEIRSGDMPLWFFVILHPEAKLTKDEQSNLVHGLERTFRNEE